MNVNYDFQFFLNDVNVMPMKANILLNSVFTVVFEEISKCDLSDLCDIMLNICLRKNLCPVFIFVESGKHIKFITLFL